MTKGGLVRDKNSWSRGLKASRLKVFNVYCIRSEWLKSSRDPLFTGESRVRLATVNNVTKRPIYELEFEEPANKGRGHNRAS